MAGRLRVTLIKSTISHTSRTRGTVRALGLHRLGETVELPDTPETRGMTRAVNFLVHTEEVAEGAPATAGNTAEGEAAVAESGAARGGTNKEESEG
ncbi:MAG TPA: 50S ribosomal protein L30 [Candidatus Caenarcaniphilales bacterium]|nr:50S ribosomal protein L30 [Candidatus Caenarcaniphilales bacterium]